MHIIFKRIRAALAGLFDQACTADPVSRMSPRELADLPIHHPKC